MRYKLLNPSPTTYALVFEAGDEVMEGLQSFASERKLKAASFKAIGAFKEAELGYFDYSIRDYHKIPVDEQVEVLSLTGDVALYGDESKLHVHVVLGKKDGQAIGGHLLRGIVRPTLEVVLTEHPGYLQRRMDEETGLPLIRMD